MSSTFPFVKGHGTENDFVLLPDTDGTLHGDLSPALDVEDYQTDLEAVIDRLGLQRFVLFGHSFLPTCIATHYAVRKPDRVSALILSGALTTLASQRAPVLRDTPP